MDVQSSTYMSEAQMHAWVANMQLGLKKQNSDTMLS